MDPPSRPANRSDDSTAVTAEEESGGDPPTRAGTIGTSAQTSRSNDGSERSPGHPGFAGERGGESESPTRCRIRAAIDNRDNRSSSGYFSFEGDSPPSSARSPQPLTADKSTQTTSPSGQVIKHALLRMAEAHGGGPATQLQHGSFGSPSSTRQGSAAGDMEAEVGQELRRIGDDFNRLFLLRGAAGRHRHVVIHPYQLPHIHQEPTVLFCMGILLLVIGRIIYLQGSTDSQDLSQV